MKIFFPIFLMFLTPLIFAKTISLAKDQKGLPLVQIEQKKLQKNYLYSLQFNLQNIDISPATKWKKGHHQFKVKNLENTSTSGAPSLPYLTKILVGHPKDFKVVVRKGKSIKLDYLPAPAPYLPCRCENIKKQDQYKFNNKKFKTLNKAIFGKHYLLESMGDFRGTPLTKLTVFPVRWSSFLGSTYAYPELKVEIYGKAPVEELYFKDELVEINRSLVILTPQNLKEGLKSFVSWKRQLGFDVSVHTLESLGENVHAADISKFFKQKYNETSFGYAILVGHEENMPTNYVQTTYGSRTPSDLPYFTYGDESDFIPDAFYSRMVADSEEELLLQTQKIIEYEKGLQSDPTGFTRGIGVASNEGKNPSDVEYVQQVQNYFEDHAGTKFDNFFEDNANANANEINKSIGKGAMWITYLGHGVGDAWTSLNQGKRYSSKDITEQLPREINPIVIDVSCRNGRFKMKDDSHPYGYFGVQWMNAKNQFNRPLGAVGYYGGSVNISWHPPAKMARGIAKNLFEKKMTRLFPTLLEGQIYLAANHDNLKQVKENFTWYHLFGDPTLLVRSQIPKDLILKRTSDSIQISDSKNSPLVDVPVVFHDNLKQRFELIYSDEGGEVQVPSVLDFDEYSVLPNGFKFHQKGL